MRVALANSYGPPSILQIHTMADPTPGEGEILVEVHASVVTEGDRRMRSADFPGISWLPGRLMMGPMRPKNPIGGTMFAGKVLKLGPGCSRFKVGDDIFGSVMHGAYGERLVVPEEGPIALMPAKATYAEAASMPYGAGSALTFIKDMAKVKAGERVLILGASGGVGRFAVQLAKHLGAEVTGVCSAKNAEVARAAGADVVLDYRKEDFRARGERYDVIFDTAMVASFPDVRPSLTQSGRFLTLFISLRIIFDLFWTSLFGQKKALFGVDLGSKEGTERIAAMWEAGVLTPLVDKIFPFEDIEGAHAYQGSRPSQGAVVIEMVPGARVRAVA